MSHNGSRFKVDEQTLSFLRNVDARIVISVIYMIIAAVNLVGNGLSMWLLLFRTRPKTPSIIFMIHLTITDLAVGAALPFQIAYQLLGYNWRLGPSMCSALTLIFFTNLYCSILTMMAIGIDRYLGIVRPMLFRDTRERKSVAVFSCLFMWALVLSVLYPFMTIDLTFYIPELEITTCFDMLKKNMLPSRPAWAAYVFCWQLFLFVFPFFVTVFCYISVIRKLAQDSKSSKKERAKRLAFVVLLVFTFCFAPNSILLLIHAVSTLYYGKSLYTIYKLTFCFSCLGSCLDPFIYYFASKEFRHKLRRMIKVSTLTSADSMRMEHKESLYSTDYHENQERERRSRRN